MPEEARLDHQINDMDDRVQELRQLQDDRSSWLREHPETTARLQGIDRELNPLSDVPEIHQELSRLLVPHHEAGLHPRTEHGPDLGIDIGL